MSEKNPLYDEDDPRGTIYADSTGDPHTEPNGHDPASGHYPDQRTQRKQYAPHTCQDCDTVIPESHDRCEVCTRAAGDAATQPWLQDESLQTTGDQETPDWTFGRVVFAVVPASTRYKALALGSSAFTLAETDTLIDDGDCRDADVKPVADFETTPARHLTAGWGDVVEVAALDSDDGERLFEAAIERTVQDSGANTHLYLTEGDPLVSQADVDTLREQIAARDERYWIVPGIVRRYESGPDRSVPDSNLYRLHCGQCGKDTDHQYTGKSTLEGKRGRPVWVCTECDTPRFGYEPGDCRSREVVVDSSDGWQNGQAELHDRVMTAYYESEKTYPWKDQFRRL